VRRTLACLAAVTLWLAPARAADLASVIVLSLDGVRHDLLTQGSLPSFARVVQQGARAQRLIPPFPSNTFPSHATLATGTHPDRHGILGNRFIDPERGLFDYANDASWLEAEPLWAAAERQGVRSAVFFWVGSETDWRGRGASLRRSPFDSSIPEAEKVDQILAWLDLPAAERPRLVMAWWHGVDRAAHRHTTRSREVTRALRAQDEQLGRLLAGLDARDAWPHTTLLLVSDHGMTPSRRRVLPQTALAEAGIAAQVVTGGGVAHIYLDDPSVAAVTAAAAALARLPGVDAWPRAEIPARLRARHPRAGDVLAMAQPPVSFLQRRGKPLERVASWLGHRIGMHGYDPQHADMAGVFLALGRGVPAGRALPAAHAIDVAPTVAALLGIDPPAAAEGRALFEPGALP